MEVKIEVGDEKFKDVLENELKAFSREELHELCRDCMAKILSDPLTFQQLFAYKRDDYWRSGEIEANELIKEAAKKVDFSPCFKEIQEEILKYVKENQQNLIEKLILQMFVDGLSHSVFSNDSFRYELRREIYDCVNPSH